MPFTMRLPRWSIRLVETTLFQLRRDYYWNQGSGWEPISEGWGRAQLV